MTDLNQSPAALPRGFSSSGKLFLRPLALSDGASARALVAAGAALPLAGGPNAFSVLEVIVRKGPADVARQIVPIAAVRDDPRCAQALEEITRRRTLWAGFDPNLRPLIMGVVNVTPDSFFDGGKTPDTASAIAHGLQLHAEGADILDVGGESTRPGAAPVSEAEERTRAIPVVRALSAAGIPVSIDTRHANIMREAVFSGARLINDVGALAGDGSLDTAARLKAPVVLMHGTSDAGGTTDPRTMQKDPRYADIVLDVYEYLEARLARCEEFGIRRDQVAIDPGIGFAKTPAHNAALFESLAIFHGLGVPVLLGASRKSFIARFSQGEAADKRLPGSVAAAQWGAAQGAQILRVHDVAETRQALAVAQIAGDPRLLPA